MSAQSDTQNVKVGIEQGGSRGFVKSGGELDIESGGAFKIAGVALAASAAELNRAAQVSSRIVNLAVSTSITLAAHDGKTIVMGGAGSARTFTLPASTGSGAKFKFKIGAVNTSNYLIKSVAGTDVMKGTVLMLSDNSAAVLGYSAGSTDDTITLNGTTTGGVKVGDWIELEDVAANTWAVTGILTGSGTEATPFSDTVA